MPHYHASHHAVARLLERFPVLAPITGRGRAAAAWLERVTLRALVAAQQSQMDLMLRLDLPLAGGLVRLYLPVTPLGYHDAWTIRTVLTEDQAQANIAASTDRRHDAARTAWRVRKGYTRPYARQHRGQSQERAVAA
jgi:hypothetical protein